MTGALLSRARGWRGEGFVRRRGVTVALLYSTLLAALVICACVCSAHANSGTLVKPVQRVGMAKRQLTSLVAVRKRAATGFMRGFPEPLVSMIVKKRVDITGSVPALRFDRLPPKPVLASKMLLLASLTPPTTFAPCNGKSEREQRAPIVGIASTYDPVNPDASGDSGGLETASGELYDEWGWTAAIRTDLRNRFGGVRYGRNYQPAYALVEAGDKHLIVRINDVGPLMAGRIIDLNQRAMRYFDPTLELGVIHGVLVTPLPGPFWTVGPIGRGGETTAEIAIPYRATQPRLRVSLAGDGHS